MLAPVDQSKVGVMPNERHKNTDSPADEQWEIVSGRDDKTPGVVHMWRLVQLRNRAGMLSPGVQCVDCGLIERIKTRSLTRFGSTPARPK